MERKGKNAIREYIEAFAVAIIAALILRAFVIQAFRIPTGSMKDTLLVGDFLLVNKFIYGAETPRRIMFTDIELPTFRFPAFEEPERGDIIVFKYPEDEKLDYIKRCVAMGGDTLEVKQGAVWINGKIREKTEFVEKKWDKAINRYINYYRVTTPQGQQYTIRLFEDYFPSTRNYGPIVIPEGNLFMMGDNRDNSADSRSWGLMPMDNIVGKALVIYLSWDNTGAIWNVLGNVRWDRIFNIIR
jgi:signal peptidase I